MHHRDMQLEHIRCPAIGDHPRRRAAALGQQAALAANGQRLPGLRRVDVRPLHVVQDRHGRVSHPLRSDVLQPLGRQNERVGNLGLLGRRHDAGQQGVDIADNQVRAFRRPGRRGPGAIGRDRRRGNARVVVETLEALGRVAVERHVINHFLVSPARDPRFLTVEGDAKHSRLVDLLVAIGIADTSGVNCRLVLVHLRPDDRHVLAVPVDPLRGAGTIHRIVGDGLGELAGTGIDRHQGCVVQLGVFEPVNTGLDVRSLLLGKAERRLHRVIELLRCHVHGSALLSWRRRCSRRWCQSGWPPGHRLRHWFPSAHR